jgi:hypothetical protein
MKVRVASENLVLAVRALGAGKAPKHVPCADWVHVRNWMDCSNQLHLTLTRTNLAWFAAVTIPCDVVAGAPRIEGDAEAVVSLRFLKDVSKQCPKGSGDVTFSAGSTGASFDTFSGALFAEPWLAKPEDFPEAPVVDDGISSSPIFSTELARAIEDVSFSMAKDICREQLKKVYLGSDHGRLFAVASDGKRIAESYVCRYDDARGAVNIGIPDNLLPSLVRLLKLAKVDVVLDVDEKSFAIADVNEGFAVVCSRDLTRCGLPDYRSLIPAALDCPEGFQCRAGDLVVALKAAMTGHDKDAPPPVQITFRPGDARAEVKGSSTARLDATLYGARESFLWSAEFAGQFAESRGKKELISFRTGAKGVRAVVAFGEECIRYAFMPVIPKTEEKA